MSPQRIQRKRTKGWRMPEGAMYVGRPTKYGNPFQGAREDAQWAVDRYTEFLSEPKHLAVVNRGLYYFNHGSYGPDIEALRGRDLVCWCALDAPCHADVLLDIANKSEVSR